MVIGLIVPVLSNFTGLANLMASVDTEVRPIVLDNWNHPQRSVAASWNEGIRRAEDCDSVLIVNDDVVLLPGTIERLTNALSKADLVSAVATDTGQHGLYTDGKPDYCCFAIKPVEFTEKFGWFDENFKQAYFEDNDMHYRMVLAGGRYGMLLEGQVSHEGSVTQFKGGTDLEDRVVSHHQFRLNRDYYQAKWGGWPGEEKHATPFNYGIGVKEW